MSAHETDTATPIANAAKEIYCLAIRAGHGLADFSAIYDYVAQRSDYHTPEICDTLHAAARADEAKWDGA